MRRGLILPSRRSLIVASPYIGHLAAYGNANVLTGLLGSLFAGLDVVSRELVGFIPSVGRAPGVDRAALNQMVTYEVAPVMTAADITYSMTPSTPADLTILSGQMAITNAKKVEFGWNGEEERGLNTGAGFNNTQTGIIAQALRTLTNMIELSLAVEGANNGSRGVGTAGTAMFASSTGDSADVRKILDDNGAPPGGRSFVMDTSSGASLRKVANLTRANEAGTDMTLRQGELLDLNGLSIKESGQIKVHTKGTAAATATSNTAGYAVGSTSIVLAATGSGTIVAGDIVTFAGDSNKYLVTQGVAAVGSGGTMKIGAPGLLVALPASAVAITVGNSFTPNLAFSDNALHLVTRLPALPSMGDAAIDRTTIIDPRSGLAFEVSVYAGERMVKIEIAIVWGVKAVKPEHIAIGIG